MLKSSGEIVAEKGNRTMENPLCSGIAEKIRALYQITQELETLFPGRHYTPDGHLIGSIGEALASDCYGITLFPAGAEIHDGTAPDGRLVQIKATQIDRVALSSEPEWLLVLKIHRDGSFSEAYNGPGAPVWKCCGQATKTSQRPISLKKLADLQKDVPDAARIQRIQ